MILPRKELVKKDPSLLKFIWFELCVLFMPVGVSQLLLDWTRAWFCGEHDDP